MFPSPRTVLLFVLMSALLGVVTSSAMAQTPAEETHTFKHPREVLAAGEITVDIMQLTFPRRALELMIKLQKAAAEDPDWFMEQLKKAKPGEPLPYDPKVGMTEAEYKEFHELYKLKSVRKTSSAKLTITVKEEDVFVLDGGKDLADLTGIEIDLKKDVVRTPFGVLDKITIIDAEDDKSALGAWHGKQWKIEKPGSIEGTVTSVKLGVGKLKKSGRCVIYYDVKNITLLSQRIFDHVLFFDPSKAK